MINWEKIWDNFEEWLVMDACEGKKPTITEQRKYIELLVEKQLRRSNERSS